MGAHGADEAKITLVEAPDSEIHEVGIPDAIFDLLEPEVLLDEAVTDAEPACLPADAAIAANPADLEVGWIRGLWQVVGEGPGRVFVELGWALHADCLVG